MFGMVLKSWEVLDNELASSCSNQEHLCHFEGHLRQAKESRSEHVVQGIDNKPVYKKLNSQAQEGS